MSTAKKLRKASQDGRLSVWVAERTPEPKREMVDEVVEGMCNNEPSMVPVGFDPTRYAVDQGCRRAVLDDGHRWLLYRENGFVVDFHGADIDIARVFVATGRLPSEP